MTIREIRIEPVAWFSGLSGDTKPTDALPFSRFIETDTGDMYQFTGSSWQRIDDAATWSITATADNLAATVTRAGEAGKSHYIVGLAGSFSAAVVGKLMTLKDGAAVIGNFHVHNQRDVGCAKPIKITAGAAVELSLAASGMAAQIGAVTLYGYTR